MTTRIRFWRLALKVAMATTLTGTVFSCGSCFHKIGANFNPCGTILNCDPVEWDLMFHDYPDWSIDPTCTIPGLCQGTWPPSSDDVGSTADTGTTTTGTTTTGTTTTGTNFPISGF